MSFGKEKLSLNLGKATNFISIYAITAPVRMNFIGTSLQSVQKSLTDIFGAFPVRLEEKDLPIIRGIAIALQENGTAWKQLQESLEKYGKVELSLEED